MNLISSNSTLLLVLFLTLCKKTMLSKKSKYAIKALIALAKNYGNSTPLRISTISEEEKIPRKFLEAILVELRNNGLVHSKMGQVVDIIWQNTHKKSY